MSWGIYWVCNKYLNIISMLLSKNIYVILGLSLWYKEYDNNHWNSRTLEYLLKAKV